jgi:hypothetical protein
MGEDDYYDSHLVRVREKLCPGLKLCTGDPYPNAAGPAALVGTRRYKCCQLTQDCGTTGNGAPTCV